ncbi:TetR/AcrR family transcriptional regulator [Sphingomonas sp. DT-204]|uniref:TetR/AcrR family transcriptional regulator n=1 Tax=Sphingomonas sp. DT-204 TaxID=3396166 RepID=UPI003F1A2E7B
MTEAGPVRVRRRKRQGDEAREEGLAAARKLLLAQGPAAVTLANVGREIGMSHANVLHHFGSAAGLQSALMGSMIRDLIGALDEAVDHLRSDAAAPRSLVDQVFDAFDEGGAGQLAAWIALSRDFRHLEPIREAVNSLVGALSDKFVDAGAEARIRSAVLMIAVCAFGDAVIGPHLRAMLGQDDEEMRSLTAKLLQLFLIPPL